MLGMQAHSHELSRGKAARVWQGESEHARGPKKSPPAWVFPKVYLPRLSSLVALEAACTLAAF